MKTKIRKRLLLSLAFGAIVFIGLTVFADAGKLASAFAQFHWIIFPVVLLCSSVNYAFRYWKWDYYTRVLDIRPSTSSNLIIFFTAFLMAVTPGKLGEVLKSYLLKQVNGTAISKSAPVILAERLTDFIGLTILILMGAWVFGRAQAVIVLLAVFFASVTALLAWRRGALYAIGLLGRLPILNRYAHHGEVAYESVYQLLRPKILVNAVVLSVISWFFECLGFWLILQQFGTPATLLKASFMYAFSTIIGAVSMLPGGLGTTEGTLTGLTIWAGAPNHIAVASTFLIRVATLWYAVVVGIVVTLAFQHRLPVRIDDIDLDAVSAE